MARVSKKKELELTRLYAIIVMLLVIMMTMFVTIVCSVV